MESGAGADRRPTTQFQTPGVKKEQIPQPKPSFRRATDDTKPVLQDPILRSDPIETEEAVLRLPPLPAAATAAATAARSSTQPDTG